MAHLIPIVSHRDIIRTGNAITIKAPATDPFTLDEVYWASDAAGNNRITTIPMDADFYVIVKTTGVQSSVVIEMEPTGIDNEAFAVGEVERRINVPINYNASTKKGVGAYRLRTFEEDEMAFKNSSWQGLTASRANNVEYTNNTGKVIMINVNVRVSDGNGWVPTVLTVNDVVVAQTFVDVSDGGGQTYIPMSAIIPPGHRYKLILGSGATLTTWAELR